jgi:hypothetical protein
MATAKKAARKPAANEPADWETIAETALRGWRESQALLTSAVQMLAKLNAQDAAQRAQTDRLRDIATKLRDGLRVELKRASEAAKNPRKRTARMRKRPPSFYREESKTFVRQEGTARGYLTIAARALKVTPRTLREYMQQSDPPEGTKRK